MLIEVKQVINIILFNLTVSKWTVTMRFKLLCNKALMMVKALDLDPAFTEHFRA